MNKIPVGQTISYAYGFTFGHLGTVVGLVWLPLLIAQAAIFSLNDLTEIVATPDQLRANPALALRGIGIGLLGYAILQFFNAVVAVAMTRQALGLRTGGARFNLGSGWDDWRMFGAYVRYFFAMIGVLIISYIIFAVLGIVLALVANGGTAAAGAAGLLALVVAVAVYSAAILTLVRMGYLLSPSIVAEKTGGIRRSYELTKGNFWRIAGVWAVTGLPLLLLLSSAEYALLAPHLNFDWGPLPQTPDAVQEFTRRFDAAMGELQAAVMSQRFPLLGLSYVYGILSSGLFYSASAFAYRAVVRS